MNKLQWNFNRNSNIFIQENTFESLVCEMAAMLTLPHITPESYEKIWKENFLLLGIHNLV